MSGSSRIRVEEEASGPPKEAPPPPLPAEPEAQPEPEPAPATPEPPPPAREAEQRAEQHAERELPPDVRKRIDRLNFERYEAKRQYDELARQVQAWEAQQRRAAAQAQPGADAEERALHRFRQEAAEREFNQQCNAVFQRGSAEYSDFGEAVRSLNAVGYGNRPDALAAIAALPDGHHVYRELAQDLDRAAKVLSLPPMQMAMELAQMAGGREREAGAPAPAAPEPRVTRAPAPLRPVGGNSARSETPLEKTSMAEFIRRRDRDERGGSQRIKRT